MTQSNPTAPASQDPASQDNVTTALLLGGVGLALLVAFALPAVQFRGADRTLLGLSPWEAVPWLTKAKLGFLALAIAAAFMPRLAAMRLPVMVAALFMMVLPSLAAFLAALDQWSGLRAGIVQMSGSRTPWIDPGWGMLALLVAVLMMLGAVLRSRPTAT